MRFAAVNIYRIMSWGSLLDWDFSVDWTQLSSTQELVAEATSETDAEWTALGRVRDCVLGTRAEGLRLDRPVIESRDILSENLFLALVLGGIPFVHVGRGCWFVVVRPWATATWKEVFQK